MNKQRLERLIVVLERVRDTPALAREFDLGAWARDCGTHCCAVGWAAQDPELAAQGLRLKKSEKNFSHHLQLPVFGLWEGWSAVQKFFELDSYLDAEWLFAATRYKTPVTEIQPVIDRLRQFVQAGGREGI